MRPPAPRCCTCSTPAARRWRRPTGTGPAPRSARTCRSGPMCSDAMKIGRGRFYGVGITSRKPGYYLSYALRRGEAVRGVVAVKVNIEEAERAWRKLPGDVLLVDERGVVILSTRDDWKYRPLAPLRRGPARRGAAFTTLRRGGAAAAATGPARRRSAPDAQLVAWTGRRSWHSTRHAAARAAGGWSRSTTWRRCASAARYAAITASLAMAVLLLVGGDAVAAPARGAPEAGQPGRAAGRARQPGIDGRRAHRRAARGAEPTWCMPARWPRWARCRPAWCTS